MVCGTCGCNNEDTSLYCTNCGAPLKTDSYGTNVENKYNTQNSFYVQDGFGSGNETEELSNSYPQNNSAGQDGEEMQNGFNTQNGTYPQSGMNGQSGTYPQSGMNGQNGTYPQSGMNGQNGTYPQSGMNGQNGTYPQSGMNGQNGMYSQNGMNGRNGAYQQNTIYPSNNMYSQGGAYPQNGVYPNNNGYNQNGYGAQGNYYPHNNVDDLDSLLGTNKNPSNRMKKSDFMKLPALAEHKKKVTGSAITIYVLTALSAAFSIFQGNYWVILDYILLIILAVAIQLKGSLVASWGLLVYGIVNSIIFIFTMGFPAGLGYIVAGIYAVIATNKLHKAYKEYVKLGYIPNGAGF